MKTEGFSGVSQIVSDARTGTSGKFFLKFSPEEIVKMATALQSERSSIRSALDRIANLNERAHADWQGEAANLYQEKIKKQQQDCEQTLLVIDEYISDLNAVSGIYQNAESTAKSAAEGLSTDGVFRN